MANLGSCMAGVADIDSSWSRVSGRTALVQSLFRRLRTTLGALEVIGGNPAHGYDLQGEIGATPQFAAIENNVLEQMFDDERVVDARADVTFVEGVLKVAIRIIDGEGPFSLIIHVSELSVEEFYQDEA